MRDKEDREMLAYANGFMACVVYQYYMSLTKEQQELWCEEMEERVIENYAYLLEDNLEFLKKTMQKGAL